jgi:signal transduction histidine kinase
MVFDARTGFLLIGALSLVIALTLWILLWRQRTPALHLWCGGSLAGSASALLLAWRTQVPDLLGFTGVVLLGALMLELKVRAIRWELKRPGPVYPAALALLAFGACYELLRQGPGERVQFLAAVLALAALNARVAWWAWRLGRRPGSGSADWIAGAFGTMALVYALRLAAVLAGVFTGGVLTQGGDAPLFALASVVGIVVSNIGWLGLALDGLIRERIAGAAAQARGEERRRLSEQIARLERQRSLGLLSASLGHELNQPLAAVLTNAQVAARGLRSGGIDREQALGHLDGVVRNTQRASAIVERIRGYIRPAETRREPVDLAQIVREVVDLVAAEARERAVACNLGPSPPLGPVAGDPIQLSQIVLNVLRNAIDAAALGARREVEIDSLVQDGAIVLRVRDSGPGFSPQALQRAGEPFFTTKTQGLGLGLSISRAIAEQHGGALRLGNAEGGGAIVELKLPMQTAPSSGD